MTRGFTLPPFCKNLPFPIEEQPNFMAPSSLRVGPNGPVPPNLSQIFLTCIAFIHWKHFLGPSLAIIGKNDHQHRWLIGGLDSSQRMNLPFIESTHWCTAHYDARPLIDCGPQVVFPRTCYDIFLIGNSRSESGTCSMQSFTTEFEPYSGLLHQWHMNLPRIVLFWLPAALQGLCRAFPALLLESI